MTAETDSPPAQSQPSKQSRPSRQSQPPDVYSQARRQVTTHIKTDYEKAIAAEFVIAVLIVAVSPFTRSSDETGISPYYGQDLIQLVAIGAGYLILGIVAQFGTGAARIAAWFGGLALVTIVLAEAKTLNAEFGLFGAGGSSTGTGSEGGVGPEPPQPPAPPVPTGSAGISSIPSAAPGGPAT
jgi:hypothetical protein